MFVNTLSAAKNVSLPPLPYAYSALEPHISKEIMTLHHNKHHQAYVTNLNNAVVEVQSALSNNDLAEQIRLQSLINFNGGGHINHSLFWKNLAPPNSPQTKGGSGAKKRIAAKWGSFEKFEEAYTKALTGVQGSGWAWLVETPNKDLAIEVTKDQDPILYNKPLLGVDMWEHAYYIQYYNDKASYIKNIYQVINWEEVEKRLHSTKVHALL